MERQQTDIKPQLDFPSRASVLLQACINIIVEELQAKKKALELVLTHNNVQTEFPMRYLSLLSRSMLISKLCPAGQSCGRGGT